MIRAIARFHSKDDNANLFDLPASLRLGLIRPLLSAA
jgi:hypothetical protein